MRRAPFKVSIFAFIIFLLLLKFSINAYATNPQINVTFREYVIQNITFDPFLFGDVFPKPENENRTNYSIYGYIEIKNVNQNYTLNDIWVVIGNVSYIINFTRNSSTRYSVMYGPGTDELEALGIYYNKSNYNDTFFNNSYDYVVLHIPELQPNETARWEYVVNVTAVNFTPLNITTNYSYKKIVTGRDLFVSHKLANVFTYHRPWQDACVYDINITMHTTNGTWSGGSGDDYYYEFIFARDDERNWSDKVHWDLLNATNRTWYFYINDSSYCLPLSQYVNFSYYVHIPDELPESDYYIFEIMNLKYRLNSLVSGSNILRVVAGSEHNYINVTKRIYTNETALSQLTGYNITWNGTAAFGTLTDIFFNVTKVTLWVAQRNNNSNFLDDANVDNDTVTGKIKLKYIMDWDQVCWYNETGIVCNSSHPNVINSNNGIVNLTKPWKMVKSWLFNYTDPTEGSPILLARIFYTIWNDNYENISKSNYSEHTGQIRIFYRTFNDSDIYNLQIYIIVDYFLQIVKNITKIPSNNTNKYRITITVHNNGASPTPKDLDIIAYDFVPEGFNITTNLTDYTNLSIYLQSPQYNITYYNISVNGTYKGQVLKFVLSPAQPNTPVFVRGVDDVNWTNENATFRVTYEIEGLGDYDFREIYLTGLDPMLIEGAGESIKGIIVEALGLKQKNEIVFLLITLGLLGSLIVQTISVRKH